MSDDPPKKPGLREPVPTPGATPAASIPRLVAEQDDTGQFQIRPIKPGEIPIVHKGGAVTIPVHHEQTLPAPAHAESNGNGNGNGKVSMRALIGIIGTVAAAAVTFTFYAFTTFAGKSDVAAQQAAQQQTTDGLDNRVGTLETNYATVSQKVDDLQKSVDDDEVKREAHDKDLDDKVDRILLHMGGGR